MRLTHPTIPHTIRQTIRPSLARCLRHRHLDDARGHRSRPHPAGSAREAVRPDSAGTPPTSTSTSGAVSAAAGVRRRVVWRRLVVVAELLVLAVVLTGSTAHAEPVTTVLAQAGSVDEVLTNLRNWLMGILAGLATVFLSVGGVRYVMAGGDPGEIEKAKAAFRGAGVGYGLAALAPLVVTVLQGIVGA